MGFLEGLIGLSLTIVTFARVVTLPNRDYGAETLLREDDFSMAGGRLYYLAQGANGKIVSMGPGGEGSRTILGNLNQWPDGIAVDKAAGHIYFTNMRPGSVNRVNMDGKNHTTIYRSSVFKVGKQLELVIEGGQKKLYWADREGQKIMRCNVDGSKVEILVDTSRDTCAGRECKNPVGVAVDRKGGWVYWTQKGAGGTGSIHRVPLNMQAGETAQNRRGKESLLKNLPQPIDLRWVDGLGLYWTDRGTQKGGNSVNKMDAASLSGRTQTAHRATVLVTGLKQGIGIAVDPASRRMWYTDLGGHVYAANLDGTGHRTIATGKGILVGIDYVP